jgi:hypothetical protein
MSVLLLVTITATAQRKNKQSNGEATAVQELARLGKWNSKWPVQINLHITRYVTPAVSGSDSADTEMTLYYDPHAFYMQAEGMEQIANDSVLVLVNNNAHMIRVFPNKGLVSDSQGNNITNSFMPDTSVEKMAQRFIFTLQEEGRSNKRIVLQSRDKINGTDIQKEVMDVIYSPDNYQPLQFKQIRRSVLPVDSAMYNELVKDAAWKGRLITTKVKTGQLFLVVKEQVTECTFTSINYAQKKSPVSEHDRVVRTGAGEYQPAEGYEVYNVSQE